MKSCEEYVVERLEKVEAELTASNKELLKCVCEIDRLRDVFCTIVERFDVREYNGSSGTEHYIVMSKDVWEYSEKALYKKLLGYIKEFTGGEDDDTTKDDESTT